MMRKLFNDKFERRDKIQVLADILKVAKEESKTTRILRLANLQYNKFKECIDQLCEAGLLKEINLSQGDPSNRDTRTKSLYKATKMGMEWCKNVEEIYQLLDEHEDKSQR